MKRGFITVREAAAMRGVTAMTVHNWIRRRQIYAEQVATPFLPTGHYWIVRTEDVRSIQVLKRGRPRKVAPQIDTPADVATRAA